MYLFRSNHYPLEDVSKSVIWGKPLMTDSVGNLIRGELNRNKQSPQCGVALIEIADNTSHADM